MNPDRHDAATIAAEASEELDALTPKRGGRRRLVTNADVAPLIEVTSGNLAAIARTLHVSRGTVWNRVQSSPELQALLEDAREGMLDNAESSLYRAAIAGEAWAVCFLLKTQGKSRGYIERVDSRSESVNLNVDVSALTEEQLRRLAAGEEPVAVLAAPR